MKPTVIENKQVYQLKNENYHINLTYRDHNLAYADSPSLPQGTSLEELYEAIDQKIDDTFKFIEWLRHVRKEAAKIEAAQAKLRQPEEVEQS